MKETTQSAFIALAVLISCGFGLLAYRQSVTHCECLPMHQCKCASAKSCECGEAVKRLEQRLDRILREARTGSIQVIDFPPLEK